MTKTYTVLIKTFVAYRMSRFIREPWSYITTTLLSGSPGYCTQLKKSTELTPRTQAGGVTGALTNPIYDSPSITVRRMYASTSSSSSDLSSRVEPLTSFTHE